MDKKQEYFDHFGEDWDKDLTAEDLERLQHLIDNVNVHSGEYVCDLGCGTGVMFDMLRRRVGEKGYIIGVDFAPRVAHKAHDNFPFHNETFFFNVQNTPHKQSYSSKNVLWGWEPGSQGSYPGNHAVRAYVINNQAFKLLRFSGIPVNEKFSLNTINTNGSDYTISIARLVDNGTVWRTAFSFTFSGTPNPSTIYEANYVDPALSNAQCRLKIDWSNLFVNTGSARLPEIIFANTSKSCMFLIRFSILGQANTSICNSCGCRPVKKSYLKLVRFQFVFLLRFRYFRRLKTGFKKLQRMGSIAYYLLDNMVLFPGKKCFPAINYVLVNVIPDWKDFHYFFYSTLIL